jgi:hypothetical protein
VTTGEDGRPPVRQKITAINGFAYGVIGADIHVFDRDRPVYLLANWSPEEAADLGPAPAGQRADLRQWRDGTPRLAARWLHGADRSRNRRLADQFAAESVAAGWQVITAIHPAQLEPGRQDLRLDGATGVLLLVADADRWDPGNLMWLLKNQLLHRDGVAARVLMTGGTADSWPAVRAMLDTYQASTSSLRLP